LLRRQLIYGWLFSCRAVVFGVVDFFRSLPKISSVPFSRFYIPGYSETLLHTFSDVRVVLSQEWLSGCPAELHDYAYRTYFPTYFVPIFLGETCYGFVLRGGSVKFTPRFCTNYLLPGCESVTPGNRVVLVEGFKDAYTLRRAGVSAIPMLGSMPPSGILGWFQSMGVSVVFVPDFDDAEVQSNQVRGFTDKAIKAKLCFRVLAFPCGGPAGDLGDFFSANPLVRADALAKAKETLAVYRAVW